MARWEKFITAILLLIAIAYWVIVSVIPAVKSPFFRDDYAFCFCASMVENPLHAFSVVQTDLAWRPLTAISWWAGWQLFGQLQWPYAIPNWILLIATALLWFILWRRWLKGGVWPLLAAFILLLHPVTTGTASWRDAIGDVVGGFMWIAAFLMYLHVRQKPRVWLLFLSLSCIAIALLYKENTVIFPLFLIAWEFLGWEKIKNNRRAWLRIAPFVILVIAYLYYRSTLLGSPFAGNPFYRMELWDLRLEYDPWFPLTVWGNLVWAKAEIWTAIAALAVLIGLVVSSIILNRSRGGSKPLWFFLAWIILAILPVIPALPSVAYDKLEYARIFHIPVIAILAMITWIIGTTFPKKSHLWIGVFFLIIYGGVEWSQSKAWVQRVAADNNLTDRVQQSIIAQGGGKGQKEIWIMEAGDGHELIDYALKFRDRNKFGRSIVWREPGPQMIAVHQDLLAKDESGFVLETPFGFQKLKIGPYFHTLYYRDYPVHVDTSVKIYDLYVPEQRPMHLPPP